MNITISNLSEDIWPFIASLPEKERQVEINENAYLSDREIWTLSPTEPTVFITPVQPDDDFLAYYRSLCPASQLEVWVTKQHSGKTCADILHDPALFQKLVQLGQQETLRLTSYSASSQFYDLVDALRAQGCTVETPQAPTKPQAWTVNFFGSKSGIRQVTQHLSNSHCSWMAEGMVCFGLFDAAALAASRYVAEGGVVIKTNKAHSGVGVKIFRPGDLPDEFEACQQAVLSFLQQEAYWEMFPIVVEKYLEIDQTVGGGNPNCEFLISEKGKLELLYTCGMRVSREGVFKGIEVSRTVLPTTVLEQLLAYGQELGEEYVKAGYRGYFDVDCVYTKDQQLLITESNVRRTGGTHVYHMARHLYGADFLDTAYTLSHNNYQVSSEQSLSFKELQSILEPLLFSPQTKEGLVIASANLLKQHTFAYVIIGSSKECALAIEDEMEKLLDQ